MGIKLLILLHFICVHCACGSDVPEISQRSKPLWFRNIRAKRAASIDQTLAIANQNSKIPPKAVSCGGKFRLKDLQNDTAEHLKIPLPKKLIFQKTYDFFDEVPKKLHNFMRNFLNFPEFQDGAEIITLPGWLDQRGHVIDGRIGNAKVILKRSRSKDLNDPNEREIFYKFMDAAKGKLRELAAIANGHTLSEEEKKLRTQRIRRQLIGLGNIVPIVGITQIQRQDESGNHVDETIEILPKVNGRTLYDCIERKLLYYDTLQGLPRNQNIAIKLLLQFTQAILSLHSCGYIRGDVNLQNIMIVPNNSSLTLKLIDWGILEQTEQPSCFSVNICRMLAIFFPILLGQQHTLDKHFPEFPEQEADIKKCLMKHFRLLRKAKIYSPKTVNTIMKLLEDILLKNDENKPDLEMIISKLEALLDENEEEDNKPKENLLKC